MTSRIHFQPVPQHVENTTHTISIEVPSSTDNHSYSISKRVGDGLVILTGITTLVATVYFLSVDKASTYSTNTTENSTEYNLFTHSSESLISESLKSLHNIVRLVQTEPNYYNNCASAFQDHWERFKEECGSSVDECMRNSIKLFGRLFCKPPSNPYGYIDDTSEICENNYFALARCDI